MTKQGYKLSTTSKQAPRVYLALHYVMHHKLRLRNVITVRLGNGIQSFPKCKYADSCTLVHYNYDTNPDFHFYETIDTALEVYPITHNRNSRTIQFLHVHNTTTTMDDLGDIGRELMTGNDQPPPPAPSAPSTPEVTMPTPGTSTAGSPITDLNDERLSTIPEGEPNDDDFLNTFYAELTSTDIINEDCCNTISRHRIY